MSVLQDELLINQRIRELVPDLTTELEVVEKLDCICPCCYLEQFYCVRTEKVAVEFEKHFVHICLDCGHQEKGFVEIIPGNLHLCPLCKN